MRTMPLSVGVLVEIEATPDAGGHGKCWEDFAAAAQFVARPGTCGVIAALLNDPDRRRAMGRAA